MSLEPQHIEYTDLNVKTVIQNGILNLKIHQMNYQKLRSEQDTERLIKILTRYVDTLCDMSSSIRFVSFYEPDDSRLRPDNLPVSKDYVESHYGLQVKARILKLAQEFRRKNSIYKGVEAEYQRKKDVVGKSELITLEETMNKLKPNRFGDLLDTYEVKRFFFPSKPSTSEYGTISTGFNVPG
jgi:hypothetical protein